MSLWQNSYCIQVMAFSCTLQPPSDVTDCGLESLILVVVKRGQHWLRDGCVLAAF